MVSLTTFDTYLKFGKWESYMEIFFLFPKEEQIPLNEMKLQFEAKRPEMKGPRRRRRNK